MFTIGVFALIADENNRILLCHRTDMDFWNLPGGGLEKGETPWQGVIREVKEETGLEVEVIKLQGVYSKTFADEIVFTFVCRIIGGNFTFTNEADNIKYYSFCEMPENTIKRHVERIYDFYFNTEGVVLREHSGTNTG